MAAVLGGFRLLRRAAAEVGGHSSAEPRAADETKIWAARNEFERLFHRELKCDLRTCAKATGLGTQPNSST
jgi:hypothetical protein